MNPLTQTKNLQKLNERELKSGLTNTNSSWHDQYKSSAWIFVGGLPYDLTEGDIIAVFSQYGEIVNINMARDKITGKQKGFAFICYEDQRSTILAVDNLNSMTILNRIIRVDHVKDYKAYELRGTEDEITQKMRLEGCGPDVNIEELSKKWRDEKKRKDESKAKHDDDDNDADDHHQEFKSERDVKPRVKEEVDRKNFRRGGDDDDDKKYRRHDDDDDSRLSKLKSELNFDDMDKKSRGDKRGGWTKDKAPGDDKPISRRGDDDDDYRSSRYGRKENDSKSYRRHDDDDDRSKYRSRNDDRDRSNYRKNDDDDKYRHRKRHGDDNDDDESSKYRRDNENRRRERSPHRSRRED